MQTPSGKKINQWCEFISSHLYVHDLMAFRFINNKQLVFSCMGPKGRKRLLSIMLSNLDDNSFDALYLTDIDEIKNYNKYADFKGDKDSPDYKNMQSRVNSLLDENPEKSNKFAKMTNREYLKWRLKVIKDGHGEHIPEAPISLKATIGLAFLSLIGIYWFFAHKTKPSIKILMGILNLFVVPALVCAIVFDLSLYFLIPAAIVYGLFVLAGCIHVGLRRYKENVKYQEEFGNTYNELMEYLNTEKPPKNRLTEIDDIEKQTKKDMKIPNSDETKENKEKGLKNAPS